MNTLYQIGQTGYTGQPPYTVTASEIVISREWESIYLRKTPLLAMIKSGKANWNKPGLRKGNLLLLPVLTAAASTAPAGVAIADEFTPITPYATNGLTQAQYNIAHYRQAFYVKDSEKQLNDNAKANMMEGRLMQMMGDFRTLINSHLVSASADSNTRILGTQYAIATANTVGNIDQATYTDWQGNVTTSAGAFSLDLLDAGIDAVNAKEGTIDLITLAFSSSNNLWNKLISQLGSAARLVNTEFSAKFGFNNVVYRDATCVMDPSLTAGVIQGFDTKSWYYAGDTVPKLKGIDRIIGTDAEEHFYNMWAGVGTNNPGKNFRLTGVS